MGNLINTIFGNNTIEINIRKIVISTLVFAAIAVAVVAYDLSWASFYQQKGIFGYAKASEMIHKTYRSARGKRSSSTYQIVSYGEHSQTYYNGSISGYNPIPGGNIVPILINPNNLDDFIIGSKSTPLQELALLHRSQDYLYAATRALVFFAIIWILIRLILYFLGVQFFNNSKRIQLHIPRLPLFSGIFVIIVIFIVIIMRFSDNSQVFSFYQSHSVGQYKVYQISKDSVVLMCDTINAQLVPFRADEVKIYTQKYYKRPITNFPIDSTVYYIAMRVKNSVAITVQATDHSENIIQNASIQFTSDSLPVPSFNTDEQYVYFRTPDTFRIFKNGKITIDTIRQFLVNQQNILKDTLLLLDAGIEQNKTMAIFMNNGRFERPSLRLEKSHLYDGENIWENSFYKAPGKYKVIYSVDKKKFSDYSYYGTLYCAFRLKQNAEDSIP